jgi:hypothetical protein
VTEENTCPSIVAGENAVAAARRMYGERHPQVAVALMQLAQERAWLSVLGLLIGFSPAALMLLAVLFGG